MPLPEIGDIITTKEALELCGYFGLDYLVERIESNPERYRDWKHLPSLKETLKEIKRILRPEGKVLIFCPNAESYLVKLFSRYWHGWHIPFHFYVFTEKTIRGLAKETSFVVKRIKTVTPDHFFTVSLKSCLWGEKDSCKKPIEKWRFFDSLVFRATISPLFRILDLVFPGRGDCLKVILMKE